MPNRSAIYEGAVYNRGIQRTHKFNKSNRTSMILNIRNFSEHRRKFIHGTLYKTPTNENKIFGNSPTHDFKTNPSNVIRRDPLMSDSIHGTESGRCAGTSKSNDMHPQDSWGLLRAMLGNLRRKSFFYTDRSSSQNPNKVKIGWPKFQKNLCMSGIKKVVKNATNQTHMYYPDPISYTSSQYLLNVK